MVQNIILPNDVIMDHFVEEFGLTSTFAVDGITLEQKLFEKSHYQEVRLGDIIRAGFGGVANNPTKAIVFGVTDYEDRDAHDILNRFNQLLRIDGRKLKPLHYSIVMGYFDYAILRLTQYSETEMRREEITTELAEFNSVQIGWTEIPTYSKTWDGFLVGDPFAYIGIISSMIDDARSGFKIWGQANSTGKTNAQDVVLLALYWLSNREGSGRKGADFVKEVFEYEGKKKEGGKEVLDYRRWYGRIAANNLPRLDEAGIVSYKSKKSSEEIITQLKDGITFRDIALEEFPPYISKEGIRKVFEYIKQKGRCSNSEIAEAYRSYGKVAVITKILRDKGYATAVELNGLEEYSNIQLLPAGYELIERINPLLEMIGWHDAIARNGGRVTYSMLDEIVRPDLKVLWQYRQDNLDTALRSQEGYNNFVRQARKARMRHIEDRPNYAGVK